MADYRDAQTYSSDAEAKKAKDGSLVVKQWWSCEDPDERAKAVSAMAKSLETNSQDRQAANLRHARLYENVEIDSLGSSDFATSLVVQAIRGAGMMRMNVVAAAEDTLAAKVAKNKPRPTFLTSGGSWDKQRKAKNLDKFARGHFYELDAYEHGKVVFYDAMTFGTGLLHLFKSDATGRLDAERVLPDEIFVDDADALYGSPRTLFRRKVMQREVLMTKFPASAGTLANAKAPSDRPAKSLTPTVEVWEAWHLPSGPKAMDGRHCIVADNTMLLSEKWKLDCFPLVERRFKKRVVGFWGKGVAETLTGIQIELNRTITSVSEQLRRKGRGRILVPMGSKVSSAHLTNGIADIVFYTGGVPPTVDSGNAVAPEETAHIERLYRMAFQEVGVSELSVASKKPSGLDAAVAMREFNEIESERFALVHQDHDNFYVDLIRLSLKLIREQYGAAGYKVRLPSKRFVIEMDWKDIGLEEEDYTIQIFPTSSLPQTPAARYAKIKEMMTDGMIDKAAGQRLLDYPDLESETNLANAAIDDVDATISAILDDEKPTLNPVEPFQNLDTMVTRANAAFLYARHHGCDDERLEMLQVLIEQATAMKAAQMAPPPMPGGMPGAPGPEMMGGMPAAPGAPGPAGAPITNTNMNMLNVPVAPSVPPLIAGPQ